MNGHPIKLRLDLGALIQKWMFQNLQRVGIQYEGVLCKDWKETEIKEDKKLKRDAFCEMPNGKRITAQLKARQPDNGNDIGVAAIQPKPSLSTIANKIK